MSIESCYKRAKNRISFICIRSAELRKGKLVNEISPHESFVIANKEADKLKF
jgi:hypothetical protein